MVPDSIFSGGCEGSRRSSVDVQGMGPAPPRSEDTRKWMLFGGRDPRMSRERVSHRASPGFPGGGLDLLGSAPAELACAGTLGRLGGKEGAVSPHWHPASNGGAPSLDPSIPHPHALSSSCFHWLWAQGPTRTALHWLPQAVRVCGATRGLSLPVALGDPGAAVAQ